MKKQILALILSLVMLLSMSVSVSASTTVTYLPPLGTNDPDVQHLTKSDMISVSDAAALADLSSNIISFGLSTTTKNSGKDVVDAADISYGFSMIGAQTLYNSIAKAVDKTWTAYGNAIAYKPTWSFYDVTGKNVSETNSEATPYTALYTFNFGERKDIDKLGFIAQNANMIPQTADIYISNDGQEWDLIAYYDRLQMRTAGDIVFTKISTDGLNWGGDADASAAKGHGERLVVFELDNHAAQYVRIATTAYNGVSNSDFKADSRYVAGSGSYAPGASAAEVKMGEIVVFGDDLISVVGAQTKQVNQNTASYDARFVAQVDEKILDAAQGADAITFKISASYTDSDHATAVEIPAMLYTVNTVYDGLMVDGKVVAADDGFKFALIEISDIPADVTVTFTILPTVLFENGAYAEGTAATLTISSAQ